MQRVAVIGAGPAGLAALRRLCEQPSMYTPVAYEQTGEVGGTWVYTDHVGTDEEGFPLGASMYHGMRANLPKEIMSYPGYPIPEGPRSNLKGEEVLEYLNNFVDDYKLRQYIKFRTSVVQVTPMQKGVVPERWELTTREQGSEVEEIQLFDAVFICNGHFSEPVVPEFPGIETFTGEVLHSQDYRHAETYKDKTVLVVGSGISGLEISPDLAEHCTQVYLCSRRPLEEDQFPANVSIKPELEQVVGELLVLQDGQQLAGVDVIIYCTGYHFSFPFLSPACDTSTEGGRVYPLYKHVIHALHPTLCFIGIPKAVVDLPFSQMDLQVRFMLASLEGKMVLPSQDAMLADIEETYVKMLSLGLPSHHGHSLGRRQAAYHRMLADLAGTTPIPAVEEEIFTDVITSFENGEYDFKKYNFKIISAEVYEKTSVDGH